MLWSYLPRGTSCYGAIFLLHFSRQRETHLGSYQFAESTMSNEELFGVEARIFKWAKKFHHPSYCPFTHVSTS